MYTVDTILLKLKLRINKLDSQDYDNLEVWQLLEAYNRAQILWVRKNLHGLNALQEGDDASKRRIDDMQVLLKRENLNLVKKDKKAKKLIVGPIPEDYMVFKELRLIASNDCCPEGKDIVVYLASTSDDRLLRSNNLTNFSFDWGETVAYLVNNNFEIDFDFEEADFNGAVLTYYKYPRLVEKAGHVNVITNTISASDVGSEFNDDVTENIIIYAAALIGGDIIDGDIVNINLNNEQQTN